MNRKVVILIVLAAFILTTSLVVFSRRSGPTSAAGRPQAKATDGPVLIAGPGRVEPSSEDIKIGSELSGRLRSVNVEEGDAIHRGEVLAELENADYRAQVESSRAN